MRNPIQAEIGKALRGDPSQAVIYWDTQDPRNPGPAYRCNGESGPLEFVRWSDGRTDIQGYSLADFFAQNGAYGGPDCDGINPCLSL